MSLEFQIYSLYWHSENALKPEFGHILLNWNKLRKAISIEQSIIILVFKMAVSNFIWRCKLKFKSVYF